MSFFNELKQRNVFKVAIAYTVVGWLLIQVAEVVAPQMNLPDWTARMVTFIVMLGFPVALVMAWALELTPEGIKKAEGNNLPVYVIAVALLALATFWFVGKEESETVPGTTEDASRVADAGSAESAAIPSVAVLPFVNMSSDADNEYFSDGITEELLNLLVKIDGLRVPSRTSSFAFKGLNTDIREIARQLGVNHVLEGSVRKSGNQVRITAQLIDVTTDTHMWSETYDRELESIFAIQDEIAGHIVEALQIALETPRTARKPTENMQAYNLYLQGLYQFRRREQYLADAEKLLRRAVEEDPQFAEAWAALALTYAVMPNYLYLPLDQVEPLAIEAAARAQALNPELVEPDLVLGNLANKHAKLLEATRIHEASIARDPKNALARLWLGISLLAGGYLDESLQQLEIARKQDPAAGIIADWQARALYMTGNTDAGAEYARQGLSLGRTASAVALLNIYLDQEQFDALDALVDELPDAPYWEAWSRIAAVRQDPTREPEVFAWLEALKSSTSAGPQWPSILVNQRIGNIELALDQVADSIPYDATFYTEFWFPNMLRVRQHPAFKQFAREQGLLELWRARGWPDLCRPVGDEDFECD